MPLTPHVEQHFSAADAVRDVVICMSDGVTVPFALAAGLAGAIDAARVVVVAGMAEIAAGSIAMGLGGYLAGRTDVEHFASELRREYHKVDTLVTLLVFGAVKARFTGINPLRGAGQTLLVGGLAAGAACALARMLG